MRTPRGRAHAAAPGVGLDPKGSEVDLPHPVPVAARHVDDAAHCIPLNNVLEVRAGDVRKGRGAAWARLRLELAADLAPPVVEPPVDGHPRLPPRVQQVLPRAHHLRGKRVVDGREIRALRTRGVRAGAVPALPAAAQQHHEQGDRSRAAHPGYRTGAGAAAPWHRFPNGGGTTTGSQLETALHGNRSVSSVDPCACYAGRAPLAP